MDMTVYDNKFKLGNYIIRHYNNNNKKCTFNISKSYV